MTSCFQVGKTKRHSHLGIYSLSESGTNGEGWWVFLGTVTVTMVAGRSKHSCKDKDKDELGALRELSFLQGPRRVQ